MAFDSLTAEELEVLRSGKPTQVVNELYARISQDETGQHKLPASYCAVWPVIRVLLVVAKVFTPKDVDAKIDEIVEAGDATC